MREGPLFLCRLLLFLSCSSFSSSAAVIFWQQTRMSIMEAGQLENRARICSSSGKVEKTGSFSWSFGVPSHMCPAKAAFSTDAAVLSPALRRDVEAAAEVEDVGPEGVIPMSAAPVRMTVLRAILRG